MKLLIKNFLILYALVCICGCENGKSYKNANVFSYKDFTEEALTLHGEILPIEVMSNMPRVLCIDSIALVINFNRDYYITSYNLNNFREIGNYVPFGSGPGEMLDLRDYFFKDDKIWTFSMNQQKIQIYSLSQFLRADQTIPEKIINFNEKQNCNVLSLTSGHIITATSGHKKTHLALYSENGTFIRHFGEVPDYGEKLTLVEQEMAFICQLSNIPPDNFLISYLGTDLLELYDNIGVLKNTIHGPDHFFPDMKQTSIPEGYISNIGKKARYGYYSPVFIENEIWILYSGENMFSYEKSNPQKPLLMNKILVFSKDLIPKRVINLDIPIYSLTIDPANNVFYGVTLASEYCIVKYLF
ncbi:MAG: TolB-like 6-bladed beta-propeller domain-containing protein [Prevotellaceae bacterium]|jgi:hypothetical protein|nr:TolB-like 6-bladed beta-propeller domain-containing protein [Prevotellaceae bacterium]